MERTNDPHSPSPHAERWLRKEKEKWRCILWNAVLLPEWIIFQGESSVLDIKFVLVWHPSSKGNPSFRSAS